MTSEEAAAAADEDTEVDVAVAVEAAEEAAVLARAIPTTIEIGMLEQSPHRTWTVAVITLRESRATSPCPWECGTLSTVTPSVVQERNWSAWAWSRPSRSTSVFVVSA